MTKKQPGSDKFRRKCRRPCQIHTTSRRISGCQGLRQRIDRLTASNCTRHFEGECGLIIVSGRRWREYPEAALGQQKGAREYSGPAAEYPGCQMRLSMLQKQRLQEFWPMSLLLQPLDNSDMILSKEVANIFIIFIRGNLMKKKGHKDEPNETKKYKRSNSPIATREELAAKRIELIIYVGNLPLSWTEEDITEFFKQYGEIIDVKLIRKNHAFTGSALVKFKSLSNAEDSIEKLKDTIVAGSSFKINIKWLDTEELRLGIGEKDDHKLFVGSLPRQASTETLFQVFSIFGGISSVRLEDTQYWAFIDYERKESALLAIKYLNGQTYLHGSRIPIEVRFKQKKYNSFMSKKHAQEDIDPFAYSMTNLLYHEIFDNGQHYYYNYQTKSSQFELPPPGAKVIYTIEGANKCYIQQQVNTLNDMQSSTRKLGPAGSNLFLFHLPNNMKDSELYNLFKKFGNILSTRVMTEKNGKSKGIGFVSFENPKAAAEAIEQMNGYQVRGKRLKVELNKKDEKSINAQATSLRQNNSYDM